MGCLMKIARCAAGFGCAIVLCAALFCAEGHAADDVLWQRTLKDYIGQQWTGEMVRFPVVTDSAIKTSTCRLMLTDEGGTRREIPFQLEGAGRDGATGKWKCHLYCVLDLPAFGERTLQLQSTPPLMEMIKPMAVEQDQGIIQIENGVLRVAIPSSQPAGIGENQVRPPLLGMQRLEVERWIGAGRFSGTGALRGLKTAVKAGAVFTDANLVYAFEKGIYNVRLRLIRGQPVVLWKEEFDFAGKGAMLTWDCAAGHELSTGLWQHYRTKYDYRKTSMGVSRSYPLHFDRGGEVTTFTPWIYWWQQDVATWMELWDAEKKWAVGIFTGDPLEWNPEDREAYRDAYFRLKVTPERQALLELPLKKGVRTFGLSLAGRTPDSRIGSNMEVGPTDTARRQIKYAETPLDEVKDYVLDYEGTPPESYPVFVFTPEQQKELEAALDKGYPFLDRVKSAAEWAAQAEPLDDAGGFWHMGVAPDARPWPTVPRQEVLIHATIAGGKGPYEAYVRCGAMRGSLEAARFILWHGTGPSMGVAPHNWMTSGRTRALNALADVAMPLLTPREREVLRGRMLFLAYKLASDRYWSVRLGFAGTANMTTLVYGELAFLSFLFPRHPMAGRWRKAAIDEIERELANWTGPNGGWLEPCHYATVSLDHIAAVAYAMGNAGLGGPLHNEQLKKAIVWLAKISTPPDPRFKGLRHFPPIGHTYLFETSCLPAYVAKVYRDSDPECANAMRWIWEQCGHPMHPGIGGAYPTSDGMREIMVDYTPAEGPPDWGSEHFPGSGAILRSGFPTDRETQLYMIQGWLHAHYDNDQGSFQLWGKGRPLCLDFGYHGNAPAWEHCRVDIGSGGKIVSFDTQQASDYLHSVQKPWDRQIVFIKEENPLGPNYFVVRDSLGADAPRAGNWWLWLYTDEEPYLDGTTVQMKGRHDVDMDVWFAPSAVPLLAQQRGGAHGIRTKPLSVKVHSAAEPTTDQLGLTLVLPAGTALPWVMYPRLRNERPASFSSLADGRGVKAITVAGTDYVFLSDKPFDYRERDVVFRGTAGAIRVRNGSVTLILHVGDLIEYKGRRLTQEGSSREF